MNEEKNKLKEYFIEYNQNKSGIDELKLKGLLFNSNTTRLILFKVVFFNLPFNYQISIIFRNCVSKLENLQLLIGEDVYF